jgi:hypothetical protein
LSRNQWVAGSGRIGIGPGGLTTGGLTTGGLTTGPRKCNGTQRQTRFPRNQPQRLTNLFLGGSFLTLVGGSFRLTFLIIGWLTANAWFSNVGAVTTINTVATPIMMREILTWCVRIM